MIITLNRDEVISLVKKQLWRLGVNISEVEGTESVTLDTEVGFINGDLAVVVGVNESVPEDIFDGEDHQDNDEDTDTDDQSNQETDKPTKQVKRRKRRTRAEIEADEAAAKQAAETQQPQQASGEAAGESQDAKQPATETQEETKVLETEPEAGTDQTEAVETQAKEATVTSEEISAGEEDNLFAPTHTETSTPEDEPPFDTDDEEVEPAGASGNPFGGDAHADEDNLFAPTEKQDVKPVTESEGGFAKPREDDDALNLFS